MARQRKSGLTTSKWALNAAEEALHTSLNAMTVASVSGRLLEALIVVLRETGTLSDSKFRGLFYVVAANIDAQEPEDEMEREVQAAMRQQISYVAQSLGVQLPAPGQTGVQRKQ